MDKLTRSQLPETSVRSSPSIQQADVLDPNKMLLGHRMKIGLRKQEGGNAESYKPCWCHSELLLLPDFPTLAAVLSLLFTFRWQHLNALRVCHVST